MCTMAKGRNVMMNIIIRLLKLAKSKTRGLFNDIMKDPRIQAAFQEFIRKVCQFVTEHILKACGIRCSDDKIALAQ